MNFRLTMFSIAGAIALMPASAHAALINVDVNSDRFPDRDPGTFVTTGAVPLGSAGDAWTPVTRASGASSLSVNDLSLVGGGASTVDLAISGFANDFASNLPGGGAPAASPRSPSVPGSGGSDYIYHDLIGDYLFSNGTITVTLSGLTDGLEYDLVVYAHGTSNEDDGAVDVTTGTVGSGVVDPTDTVFWVADRTQDLTEGLDYVRFSSIQSVGGVIELTIADKGTGVAAINGLQLFVVPEPGSLGLLGLGAITVLSRRRKA